MPLPAYKDDTGFHLLRRKLIETCKEDPSTVAAFFDLLFFRKDLEYKHDVALTNAPRPYMFVAKEGYTTECISYSWNLGVKAQILCWQTFAPERQVVYQLDKRYILCMFKTTWELRAEKWKGVIKDKKDLYVDENYISF